MIPNNLMPDRNRPLYYIFRDAFVTSHDHDKFDGPEERREGHDRFDWVHGPNEPGGR